MFKRILMWGTALLFLGNYASAQNFFISGGNKYSAVLCQNGNVFTWGNNDAGQLGRTTLSTYTSIPGKVDLGIKISAVDAGSGGHAVALACDGTVWTWGEGKDGQLGNGGTTSSITPVQVKAGETNIANPTSFLQDVIYVTSGTSQSYAITADKKLLAWGSNRRDVTDEGGGLGGQLGTDSKGWVNNAGVWSIATSNNSPMPVYVRDENGNVLNNVISVDAGDYHCYALVDDDNDGDATTGRVYSWGVAYGAKNPVTANALGASQSVLASPVLDIKGKALTGIYMITGGDAMGYFVQKGTGYVYSVGSNNEGQRGDGQTYVNATATDPKYNLYATLVKSGALEAITGDQNLSNVTGISAGQTHGMAMVDINGKSYMLSWGGNTGYVSGSTLAKTGALGQKGVTYSEDKCPLPGFVLDCDGKRFENVTSISDGDFTSYAVTLDPITNVKSVWIWGHNGMGQVGLGKTAEDKTTMYECPMKFEEPACSMGEPCPVADLGGSIKYVCPGSKLSEKLYAGSDGPYSEYKWERLRPGQTVLQNITNQANGPYLTATSIGKYIVTITDIRRKLGVEMPCNDCPVVSDTIDIVPLKSPFDTVFPIFCGTNGTFKVKLKSQVADPTKLQVTDYEFFSAETGGISLGKKTATTTTTNIRQDVAGQVEIDVANLKTNAYDKLAADFAADPSAYPTLTAATAKDSIYSIWIEDQTITKGSILDKVTLTGSGDAAKMAKLAQLFTVYSDVYVRSAVVSVSNFSGSGGVLSLQPFIYKNKTTSTGIIIADFVATPVWSGAVQNFPMAMNSKGDVVLKFEDASGKPAFLDAVGLRGTSYSLGFKVVAGAGNFNMVGLGSNFPPVVSSLGTDIQITDGTSEAQNKQYTQEAAGALSQFILEKPTDYVCGRKEISVIKKCDPCAGIVKGSLLASVSNDTICVGEQVKVSFVATKLANADANKIKFEWSYWDGKTASPSALPTTGLLGTLSSASAFDASTPGYYIVKLSDDTDPTNGKCIFEDTVRLDTATTPKYTFSTGQTLCKGAAFNPIDVNLTGFGPWSITLSDGTTTSVKSVGALKDVTGKYTFTPDIKAVGTTSFGLTAISDKYCTGITGGGDTAKVVVNGLPTSTFVNPSAVCTDAADINIASSFTYTGVTGVKSSATTFYGTGVLATDYLSASGVFSIPTVTAKTTYPLYVRYEDLNGCKFGDTAEIVVNPIPVVTFDLKDKYCNEETINYAAAASLPSGVFSVSPTLPLSGGSVAASLLTHKTDYTFSYLYTDANGCDTTVSDKTYGIKVPAIVSTKDFSIAGVKNGTSVPGDLTATRSDAAATMNWLDPAKVPMTGAAYADKETINATHIASNVATTFVYKAFQSMEGCYGDTVDVKFMISPCSALVPVVSDAYFCADEAGKQITASLDPTRATDQIGWIDASYGASAFTSITSYTDPKVTGNPTMSINKTDAGEYKFFVAAWEESNGCWSSAKEVTFIVEPNPKATIESQAKAACYNYNTPKPITVTPFHNAVGITPHFTVDGVAESVPQYLPSKKSTGGTMTITYDVDSLITPAGYASPKTCKSNTATSVYTVEFAAAPTITSVTVPVDQFPYTKLTVTGATGNSFNWYTSATSPRSLASSGTTFDPSLGVKYDTDQKFTVYATQLTPNGCESADGTGYLELVKCKHLAPIGAGFKECANTLDGTEALTLASSSPSQSVDAIYTWYDADGTTVLGTGKSFIPTNVTAGIHSVKVGVVDWTDPVLLPGKTCPSPKSDVTYEIYETPVPSISGIVADMCIYDNSIVLKGKNKGGDLHPNGIGVFNLSFAAAETSPTYSFSPQSVNAGVRTLSFTYTTENGCTEKSADYTITVHEVPAPVIDANAYNVPQIAEILKAPYNGTFTFTGSAATGTTLQWFTTKPAVISSASSTNVGSQFIYTLAPQPVDRPDIADSYDYTVYANQKITAPITCYSEPIDVKITTTDCPTPKPTVTDAIACDYWTGAKVPALVGTRGTNWGAYTPDNNTSLYKTVNGTEILSVDGKHVFTDISVASKIYSVEYRAYSPDYKCYSPKVTAKLDVKTIAKPTVIKGAYSTCFDDVIDRTFEVATVAGQKATWYALGDSASTKLGSDTKYTVNPKDGTKTVFVSMKLDAAPYCESDPALVSATLTVNPLVVPPTVVDNLDQCATSFDIDPISGKAKFPSATLDYELSADNGTADDIVWRLSASKTAIVYNTGSLIFVAENDNQIGLLPDFESYLYAFSEHKYGALTCSSEGTKATIKPKPTPLKPAKIVDGEVSDKPVTFICQGSNQDAPVYRAQKSYGGEISWFDEVGFALNEPILIADELDLEPYLNTSGKIKFIATETFDECESDSTTFIFEVAPRPNPTFGTDALYYCADPKGSTPLIVSVPNREAEDNFKYEWLYSYEDGDKSEFVTTEVDSIKTWYYSTPGIDEATVIVTNKETGCKETATIRLNVAELITPSFAYDVYSGPQEIVFRNQETSAVTSSVVWDMAVTETEPYSTRYNWTFVYNADQSVRKMVQKDSTRTDRQNSLYYVGRGPSDYDSVIVLEHEYTDTDGKNVKIYSSKVDDNEKGVRVTEFNGKTVQVHGGIPFEYGISTVTLTRSLFTMDGIPYDTRSCTVTSPEVEVFMPITTGLFIPTSFAPGHSSPLVAVFKPFGSKIAEFNIWVYDNWGNTVFYSNKVDENGQPTEAWDGRDKAGNPMPADVYYWKVDATFEDGTKWEGNPTENGKLKQMGSVFLLR